MYTVRVSPASVPSRARILDGTRMPYLYCVRPHERAPRFANVPFRLRMSRRKEALAGYTLAAYTLASFAHDVAAIAADFDALARVGD